MKKATEVADDSSSISSISRELFLKGNRSEIVLVILVMAILLAMILPLPTWLLDVLIAINISLACLLVVLVLQIKDSTHLTTFPALLLITTLFRVSINVASTRKILLEANAGEIIETFGEVVVGGNIVVGIVIFSILTLVQFLVISKGAERVAEVGARFALDAMPGKQLTIDIEVKTGNISTAEAQARRSRLSTESQFFGAMDGALKFVKGDTIAGILIIFTNLIAGFAVGVMYHQMSAGESARLYTLLTIGDALVSQIPALLSSISAGLLITRISDVSGGESEHTGQLIATQFSRYPKAWMSASIAMAVFGLIPGMPWPIFFTLSAGSYCYGIFLLRNISQKSSKEKSTQFSDFDEVREFQPVCAFLLQIKKGMFDVEKSLELVRVARRTRNNLVTNYAFVSPAIETQSDCDLSDAEVVFCHNEVPFFKSDFPCGHRVASCTAKDFSSLTVTPIKVESHAWNHEISLVWLPQESIAQLDALKIYHISDWELFECKIQSALFKLAPKHFGIEQASKLIRWLAITYPETGKELERNINVQRFTDVLQRLMQERVSIRNVLRITELLVEWASKERDPSILTECVRHGISREIAGQNADDFLLMSVLLSPIMEDRIREAIRQTAFGDYVALDPIHLDNFLDSLYDIIKVVNDRKRKVILTSPDIRSHVRSLVCEKVDDLAVMSLPEVPPDFKVHVLGVISGDISDIADDEVSLS